VSTVPVDAKSDMRPQSVSIPPGPPDAKPAKKGFFTDTTLCIGC
jgi:hypothetical protein